MRYACHMVHSVSQLTHPDNVPLLRDASIVVIAPTIDVQRVVQAAPNATLLVSFNAAKLYMGSQNNAYWNATRDRLLARKRTVITETTMRQVLGVSASTVTDENVLNRVVRFAQETTSAFVYDSAQWGGPPVDTGDPTPHVLIEPTLENAEAYADVIRDAVNAVADSANSAAFPYIDDSPRTRPVRLRRIPEDYWRWRGYLSCLFSQLTSPWSNCAGEPAAPFLNVTCEYPRTSTAAMLRLVLGQKVASGLPEEGPVPHILWGGEGAGDLWMKGVYLT